jgi:hypothetical protein
MSMPETAVNEHSLSPARKIDVNFSRKLARVQAVAIAKPMKHSPHRQFRPSVHGPDRLHDFSALLGRARIHRYAARSFEALNRTLGFFSCT